ncbi:hypothetical protein ABPG72_019725 [Tetrahymena utriculariae]
MIKPIDVRQISYYPSMKRLLQYLHPVLKTISDLNKEDFSIEYTSFLFYFKQISNIIFIGYYTDILNHIYILTKTLKKRNISIEVFQFEYNKCIECLNRLKELNFDDNNSIVEEEITTDQYSIWIKVFLLDEELVLKGKGNYSDHFVKVKERITPMIDFLIQQLKIRFENNDFINNFDCLNKEAIKKLSQTEVDNFGNKQIANLIKFYKQNGCKDFIKFDEKSFLPNYLELKYLMKGKLKCIQEILNFLEQTESNSQLYHLFKLYFSFPQTTVECERIFSQAKLILTKQRCNLITEQLNTLMMISRNGEKLEEFEFFEVIYHSKSNKKKII